MPATKAKPSPSAITAEVVKITPEMAARWLDANTHNRRLRQKRVDDLVEAIQRGEWMMNGDAIRFAPDGTLVDGQHRLWAIALSDVACESLVIRGVSKAAQQTIDTGTKRNLTDALTLRGESNAAKLAATVSYAWRMEQGAVRRTQVTPTVTQALAYFDSDTESFRVAVRATNQSKRGTGGGIPGVSAAMLAAVWRQLQGIDSEACDAFYEHLLNGTGLDEGHPVLVLRRHYANHNTSLGARASSVMHHALLIKAWNFWKQGVEIDRLMWKVAGTGAEPFPEPIA